MVDVMRWRETLVANRTGTSPPERLHGLSPHHCQALILFGGVYPRAVLSDRNSVAPRRLCGVTLQSTRNREPGLDFSRTVVVRAAGMPPISSGTRCFYSP